MNFLEQLKAGLVSPDEIHTFIEEWHEAGAYSDAAQMALHEFLGLQWWQYKGWAETGEIYGM